MNTHLKQLWAAMKLPEKLQKKLYIFCRGLDIRVAQALKNLILFLLYINKALCHKSRYINFALTGIGL